MMPGPGSVAAAAAARVANSASSSVQDAAVRRGAALSSQATAQGIQAPDYFDARGTAAGIASSLQAQAPTSGVGMVPGGALGSKQ